ncbi:MAG: hypothetical protein CUN49_13485 [Candidatus Thermofonsia Clade 1 bacterium]|jgi:hypothetical protein|uniref:STAS/SEC14 domain-containing protein n=1 Tax=Candidatus Thermofonsia Clade 1 bacterium TaxID=2364210 RepID=A0A2M8PBD5_9CHLR|nr:MAG: hypothetical protein CUN49_13485 [Candidatus Thermofonsia Clade 1 bacterium]
MPIHIEWYDPENNIVLSTFIGDTELAEIEEALTTYIGFLEKSERMVHFMADMRQLGKAKGFAFSEIKLLQQFLKHPRMGYTVMIGRQPGVHFVLKVLSQLFNLRYATFGDVEEGARYLREVIRIHGL